MGAFTAFYVALRTGNLGLAMLAAAAIGALMGLAMAYVSVDLQAVQGISGIGFYLFGLGMSTLLFQMLVGTVETVSGFAPVRIPLLSDLPVVGDIFFRQNILVYVAFALVPIARFVLNRTTLGLKIRAVGENPAAADSLGVSIRLVRYITVTLGGLLSGVAGASMSIGTLNVFQQNMTSGLGFIAVALVYFGGWRPAGVLFGALLFSLVSALQLRLQLIPDWPVPSDLMVMTPYIVTVIALVLTMQRVRSPSALTKAFERGG
jgi:simple sugar transport system permease protein